MLSILFLAALITAGPQVESNHASLTVASFDRTALNIVVPAPFPPYAAYESTAPLRWVH